MANEHKTRPHVVIVGGGFGGLEAARPLVRAGVRVTLVDRRNHHLFQPLLYQVATAGLSPADIAAPIRSIVGRDDEAAVVMGEVVGVDTERQTVKLSGAGDVDEIAYDFLVLATGARHAYFGHDEWEAYAPGLKAIEDAVKIRERILRAFEEAEVSHDADEVRAYLTFVIVGAGPTGVELAGAIAELSRRALAADFRTIDPGAARVVLVEAGPRLLPAFPDELGKKAGKELARLGVTVMTERRVTAVDARGVALGDERLAARTVIWAAGVQASPAGKWLGVETDKAGRVKVERDCGVPGLPNVFVIGDAASFEDNGALLPGVAPVAMQQGRYVAKVIRGRIEHRVHDQPFRYVDKGNLATVGRLYAVGSFRNVRFTGFVAWVVWALVHIYYLIGYRNRLVVLLEWGWAYLTFQRGARLITGAAGAGQIGRPRALRAAGGFATSAAAPDPLPMAADSHTSNAL